MRIPVRWAVPACLAMSSVAGVLGVAGAPIAAAGCNDSSGTVVCAQGDIRGTHAQPPARPEPGPGYGTWCNSGGLCFGPGIAIFGP